MLVNEDRKLADGGQAAFEDGSQEADIADLPRLESQLAIAGPNLS